MYISSLCFKSDTQVVEAATEDYPEVQDLLKRFTTLKDANRNLNEAQARDEGETERLRSEFSSYTKERRAAHCSVYVEAVLLVRIVCSRVAPCLCRGRQ